MEKHDCFVYYKCISGYCPLLIEENKYGGRISTCESYCGDSGFCGCNNCCFEHSNICDECIHSGIA